jgi:tRNA (mo5U34)-methyltransferase
VTALAHLLGDSPRDRVDRFAGVLPADLHGQTVLDVGCSAGLYTFEMARRGAARVVGIDSDPRSLAQARLAAQVLGIDVELRELDVYHVAELRERFDLVIFMGALCHLRHPLLALDLLHDHAVADRLLFQCIQRGSNLVAPVERDYPLEDTAVFQRTAHPAMYFVEHRYAGDWTHWWIPNRACVEAMLRSAGFTIESHPARELYLCRRAARRADEHTEATP